MIQILSFNRTSAGFMFQYDKHIVCAFRCIISQHVTAGRTFPTLHKREHLWQLGLGMWPGTPAKCLSQQREQISRPSDSTWGTEIYVCLKTLLIIQEINEHVKR